jgi:hypothetical protein
MRVWVLVFQHGNERRRNTVAVPSRLAVTVVRRSCAAEVIRSGISCGL